MKLRDGFVSNSSSTSFCIFGTCISDEKLREMILSAHPEFKEDENDDVVELVNAVAKQVGCDTISAISSPYDDYIYVGLEYASLQDDETGSQFKNRTKETLKAITGQDIECSRYEESWHDN
jgi:hypothetical protein